MRPSKLNVHGHSQPGRETLPQEASFHLYTMIFPSRAISLIALFFSLTALVHSDSARPVSPLTYEDTGTITYADWHDGKEQAVPPFPADAYSLQYLWTDKAREGRTLYYGDSKNPGKRYLRVALGKPVTIGSILVRGGGSVSVLKAGAAQTADLSADDQWVAAERIKNGAVSHDEAGPNDVVVWTLPEPITTQAIRFTHDAQAADRRYAGTFEGLALFPNRLTNVAPQAWAFASAAEQNATKLIDENSNNEWSGWENISSRDGQRATTIADSPEWVMLVWPKPVPLSGLALLGNQYGSADIQVFTGTDSEHPREAAESEWKTLQSLTGIKPQAPSPLDMVPVSFDATQTVRAIRLRFTSSFDEATSFFRLKGNTRGGKRVGLAELMALESLDTKPIADVILPIEKAEVHAPIPIKFTLPEAGEVTLVVEDSDGKRVRNLVSQTPFPAGENTVYWDGTDDITRDPDAANHGFYYIPPEFVAPGAYEVRGIWHKPLDLRYEFSVYEPGTPPWDTADTSGGWMTNHTPASSAVFIPGDKAPGGAPLIGLGAAVSEGGSAFSWLDLDGKKIGGRGWIGGVWTGAYYLAGDQGPDAEPGVAAYVGSVFQGNKKYGVDGKIEIRLTKLTTLTPNGDKPVVTDKILLDSPPAPPPGADPAKYPRAIDYLGGIAVYNGFLVYSEPILNKIVFVNSKGGGVVGGVDVTDPHAVAYDATGRLLVLSGHTLLRYAAGASVGNMSAAEELVTGLDNPRGLTLDAAGKIYISDQGSVNQVKVYSPDGKPVMTYGKPGPLGTGQYDPLHMNSPKGIAVDSNGRLWVTEDDYLPKRVSVWNPDGSLWKAYYGGPRYGGGGMLDSHQVGTFLYDGMEFKLDWDKGEGVLTRVYYRPGSNDLPLAFRDEAPEAPVYFNGKRYLSDCYNSGMTQGHNSAFLFLDKGDGGVVVPVAGAGAAQMWPILKTDAFKGAWPKGLDPAGKADKNAAFFIWSDLNGDGQAQPNEVQIVPGNSGGVTVGDDGSFLISRLGTDVTHLEATRFKPARFTEAGAPVYDASAGEALAPAQPPGGDGHDQVLIGTNGWTVMTTPPPPLSRQGLGGARNGQPMWSYPSLWPGLHPSHSAPVPSEPGMLIGTTRLLGGLVTPKGSEAAPLFFINSNQGNLYAFTEDGLFVAQLFQDMRQGILWEMPNAIRNTQLNSLTLHDENFLPSVAQNADGQVYIDSGGQMAIVRVDNLNTIRNIPPSTIQVSSQDLIAANKFVVAREAARQAAQGSGLLRVGLLAAAPAFTGGLSGWTDADWAPIDHRGASAWFNSDSRPFDVNGAVAIADSKLYAAWKTGDPRLLQNAGDVPNALFKSGGALDLMIGTDSSANPGRPNAVAGDERLLVAQVDGKTKALLYRQVVPGTQDKDKVPFNAPWHGITFDQVADVTDQVQLEQDNAGDYQVTVPLSLLGLNPQPGMKIKGDIGVLRGNGRETSARVYWANKATGIVSDVPTEAELTPGLWGTWEFTQK